MVEVFPQEIFQIIFSFIPGRFLFVFYFVCKKWYSYASEKWIRPTRQIEVVIETGNIHYYDWLWSIGNNTRLHNIVWKLYAKKEDMETIKKILLREWNLGILCDEELAGWMSLGGDNELVKLIIKSGIRPNNEILYWAFANNDQELINLIIDHENTTPTIQTISKAIRNGTIDYVKYCSDIGILDIFLRAKKGLHNVCACSSIETILFISENYNKISFSTEFINLLIEKQNIQVIKYLVEKNIILKHNIDLTNVLRTGNIVLIEYFMDREEEIKQIINGSVKLCRLYNKVEILHCQYLNASVSMNTLNWLIDKKLICEEYMGNLFKFSIRYARLDILKFLLEKEYVTEDRIEYAANKMRECAYVHWGDHKSEILWFKNKYPNIKFPIAISTSYVEAIEYMGKEEFLKSKTMKIIACYDREKRDKLSVIKWLKENNIKMSPDAWAIHIYRKEFALLNFILNNGFVIEKYDIYRDLIHQKCELKEFTRKELKWLIDTGFTLRIEKKEKETRLIITAKHFKLDKSNKNKKLRLQQFPNYEAYI